MNFHNKAPVSWADEIERRYHDAETLRLLRAMLVDEFAGRIALVSSFGADSVVLLDLVARIDPSVPVLFLDTGKHFDATLQYKERVVRRLGLTDVRDVKVAPERISEIDPGGDLWRRDPDACCTLRKVEPLAEALDGFAAWITGRKRYQGGSRSNLSLAEDVDGRIKINPLAYWSAGKVDEYIESRELPVHPLSVDGYPSIGCFTCTARTGSENSSRDGRWKGRMKTECGIHLPRGSSIQAETEATASPDLAAKQITDRKQSAPEVPGDYPSGDEFILYDGWATDAVGSGRVDPKRTNPGDVYWHDMKIDKIARARANAQLPSVLWFTGLSGAGKSTIADQLEQEFHKSGYRTYLLDGDNVRHGLNKDLGFSDEDRVENIRRVAEVAKLMADAGLIVLVSFISPFRGERQMAREMMDDGEFIEIFVDTPLEICEERDPKGLYKKARAGEIKDFTGIDSAYEEPANPEITLRAGMEPVEVLVDDIVDYMWDAGRIK